MTRRLWPRLALISCWTDAAAGGYAADLQRLFPHVEMQPKGLLATEGCVSFPLVGRRGAALALRSHFFEFEETCDGGTTAPVCRLAHELEPGGRYGVVLTTGGGLYRYRLRDVVEVVGFENRCPLIVFRGRPDSTCDLVGEKLSEPHVGAVLRQAFAECGVRPQFALVVPIRGEPPRYRLYLQLAPTDDAAAAVGPLLARVEAGLEQNPHYRYAVQLGQLGEIELKLLDPAGTPAWLIYERRCLERGRKIGDIKPAALDAWEGWAEAFASACSSQSAPRAAMRG